MLFLRLDKIMLTLSCSTNTFLQNLQNTIIKFHLFVENVLVHKTKKMYNWGKGYVLLLLTFFVLQSNLKNKEKKIQKQRKPSHP